MQHDDKLHEQASELSMLITLGISKTEPILLDMQRILNEDVPDSLLGRVKTAKVKRNTISHKRKENTKRTQLKNRIGK